MASTRRRFIILLECFNYRTRLSAGGGWPAYCIQRVSLFVCRGCDWHVRRWTACQRDQEQYEVAARDAFPGGARQVQEYASEKSTAKTNVGNTRRRRSCGPQVAPRTCPGSWSWPWCCRDRHVRQPSIIRVTGIGDRPQKTPT